MSNQEIIFRLNQMQSEIDELKRENEALKYGITTICDSGISLCEAATNGANREALLEFVAEYLSTLIRVRYSL